MASQDLPERSTAPIFPLPNLVLPPGTSQVLHIFEPRYRAMLAFALEGCQRIAIALQDLHRAAEPDGTPRLHEVLGLGEIVRHVPRPDGRSFIVVSGIARCRVLGEERHRPFRVGHVQHLPSVVSDFQAAYDEALRLTCRLGLATSQKVCALAASDPDRFPERVADKVLGYVPVDVLTRQRIFSLLDVNQRLAALHRIFDAQEAEAVPEQN